MPLAASLRNELIGVCGPERVSFADEDRRACARDMWPLGQLGFRFGRSFRLHEAVVWPETTAEVASVVDAARRAGVAVVPVGAGSGVCGI